MCQNISSSWKMSIFPQTPCLGTIIWIRHNDIHMKMPSVCIILCETESALRKDIKSATAAMETRSQKWMAPASRAHIYSALFCLCINVLWKTRCSIHITSRIYTCIQWICRKRNWECMWIQPMSLLCVFVVKQSFPLSLVLKIWIHTIWKNSNQCVSLEPML